MKALANKLTNNLGMSLKQSSFMNFGFRNMSQVFMNKAANNKFSFILNKKFTTENKKNEEKSESDEEDKKKTQPKEDKEETLAMEKYKEMKTLYNEQNAKMEVLKKKFEELRQAYLHNVDETEQIKKRNDREIANTKEFAISKFAKDILDVHDNFNRAMESIADKDFKHIPEAEKIETYNTFLEGMKDLFNLLFRNRID
jgi:molecular chaperone GrpE (heat shock protein)